ESHAGLDRRVEAGAAVVAVAVTGGGEDDRLVGVVVAPEDGDGADVEAEGRAEVGERDPRRSDGIAGEEVSGLPDSAGGTGGVNGVARGVGGIDGDAADAARVGAVVLAGAADGRPGVVRLRV